MVFRSFTDVNSFALPVSHLQDQTLGPDFRTLGPAPTEDEGFLQASLVDLDLGSGAWSPSFSLPKLSGVLRSHPILHHFFLALKSYEVTATWYSTPCFL